MASSRLEKIGNIYTRIQGLLKSGAMKHEDRPIFYDIYQAFPPLKDRQYFEEIDPKKHPIRPIFYFEDKTRAERDDSNTLFNLNDKTREERGKPSEQTPYRRQESPASAPQDKQKIFDMKEISDLKK